MVTPDDGLDEQRVKGRKRTWSLRALDDAVFAQAMKKMREQELRDWERMSKPTLLDKLGEAFGLLVVFVVYGVLFWLLFLLIRWLLHL